jgi:DNA-directed RNA polymerase specialized sigma24 family protein
VFLALVNPHLNRLYHFVGHLIRYAEAMGDLVENDLAPEDVVDGALVRAYRQFLRVPTIPDAQKSLLRLALDQLDAEVLRLSVERAGTVHIEDGVPEIAPTQEVSAPGDEIVDFYRSDRELKVEDVREF